MRTDIGLVVARLPAALHGSRRKVPLEIPHDRKVAVEIYADAFGSTAPGCRATILPPPRMIFHAEVAPIGIHLGKENDVLGLDDPSDLGRREHLLSQTNALAVAIGAQEPNGEVYQNVRPSPLAAVYAGDETDGGPLLAPALADPNRVAAASFPSEIGQRYTLQVAAVVLLAEDHCPLDLVDGEVAATPDHIAVVPFLSRAAVSRLTSVSGRRWGPATSSRAHIALLWLL